MSMNESAKALPGIFVDTATINMRVKLYMQNKHPLLSEAMSRAGTPRSETRSVWYSRKHVETWLDEMDITGANGLRIYLGEYEAADSGTTPHPELAGQLCLLMVLTRQGAPGETPINIIYENEPGYMARKANTVAEKDIFGNPDQEKQFNFGAFCPPICLTGGDDYPNDSVT
jgi:hypothetical protein